jgi:hypothetical protein
VDTLIQTLVDGNNQSYASATYNTGNGSGHVRQWIHVVSSRQNGYLRLFVNGVLREANTNSTNINGTSTTSFGTNSQLGGDLTELYISNFRMCIGSVPASYSTTSTTSGTTIFTSPTSPVTVTSQGASNVTLLLFQSNRFVDNSPYNFAITTVSNPSIQAFGPFGSIPEATPISYSNYFDGSGDYLSIPYSSAFNLTGDFTVECWVNFGYLPTSIAVAPQSYSRIFAFGTYNAVNSLGLEINSNESSFIRKFIIWYNGTAYQVSTNNAVDTNIWYHVAVVRSGTIITLYINGTSTGLTITSASAAVNTTQAFYIASLQGYESDTSAALKGYISNFRILKGTALYTTTFTPPTTPLTAIANTSLLTCQSTRMIDNSTNAFTITAAGNTVPRIFNPFGYTAQTYTSYTPTTHGGSAYFDGTGDYLTLPSNSVGAFGTGDFTIECWIYLSGSNINYRTIVSTRASNGTTTGWCLATNAGGDIYIYSGAFLVTASSAIVSNTWYHIAVCRVSGTTTLYLNGVSMATSATARTYSDAGLSISADPFGATELWQGYISDLRLIKGTAVYTTAFTPPTQTLTNYSATYPSQLLLNFNNGGIVDQHSTNVLETVGGTQLSTSVKKYNVASIYLGGSGNYLQLASTTNLDFGTGDFTIECWVYNISIAVNYPTFISSITGWSAGASGHRFNNTNYANKFWFGLNGSGGVNGGDPFMASSNTFSFNTWYHYALTRSGNTWRMFVNGTLENTQTFSGSYNAAYGGMRLGYSTWDGVNGWFNGYLDDLRFTKGYARYTSNFTAPTSALITK